MVSLMDRTRLVPMSSHNKKSRSYSSTREAGTKEWVGVDGEGVTGPWGHRYVYLACGEKSVENPDGLEWREIFEFLYSCRQDKTAYVGFYLGYDFTQWLKTLPENRAWRLLSLDGKASRKSRSPKLKGRYLPVDLDGWQVDILGSKRIQFRPKHCDCTKFSCEHPQEKWMHVCDAGPFFQCSFLDAINPDKWQDDAPCTREEFATIVEGKARRATAVLDDEMRSYCHLEVRILATMMKVLDQGFRKLGIVLTPQQWFGPGQAAQKWLLAQPGRIKTKEFESICPEWFWQAARDSYFGGWFEIMCHGIVPGNSYEYDLNSAYPAQIMTLPCLRHGKYSRGQGRLKKVPGLFFVRAKVTGSSKQVGAMMHRWDHAHILRPHVTEGWFELRELNAARAAKCIDTVEFYEWVRYEPCDCAPPFGAIAGLYQTRLDLGKDSIMGKACKLVYNSAYGKFAQSIGNPTTSNPVYAAMITAGCRTAILDAIGSHPNGHEDLLMVATDAVFFHTPHQGLPLSKQLGKWDVKIRCNLTLFKPGVYWDDSARAALAQGDYPSFKARGISARDFANHINDLDVIYGKHEWLNDPAQTVESFLRYVINMPKWPRLKVETGFSMTTCLQALNTHHWDRAGMIESKIVDQSSDPSLKRTEPYWDEDGFYRTEAPTLSAAETIVSVPYEKRFGMEDPNSDDFLDDARGVSPDEGRPFDTMFRILREGVDVVSVSD